MQTLHGPALHPPDCLQCRRPIVSLHLADRRHHRSTHPHHASGAPHRTRQCQVGSALYCADGWDHVQHEILCSLQMRGSSGDAFLHSLQAVRAAAKPPSEQDAADAAPSANAADSTAAAATESPRGSDDEISCFATGMDVTCTASFDDMPNPITGSTEQPAADGIELAEQQPLLSAGAQLLSSLLLVSPFFFWGTSMVGMKVSDRESGMIECAMPD